MADIKSEIQDSAETARDAVVYGVDAARKRFQKLGDQAQDTLKTAQDTYQKVTDQVQDRYKKISHDVRRGAERAQKEIRRGADKARETYGDVTEKAQKHYARVRSEAGNVSREVSLYVRDNPAKAVLIAAGVGFLLGLVVRGRRSEEE